VADRLAGMVESGSTMPAHRVQHDVAMGVVDEQGALVPWNSMVAVEKCGSRWQSPARTDGERGPSSMVTMIHWLSGGRAPAS